VVRAIAYSGLRRGKAYGADAAKCRRVAANGRRLSHRRVPTLNAIELDKSPTFLDRSAAFGVKPKVSRWSYRPQSRTARHLVGQYFARRPVPADLAHHHALAVVEGSATAPSG